MGHLRPGEQRRLEKAPARCGRDCRPIAGFREDRVDQRLDPLDRLRTLVPEYSFRWHRSPVRALIVGAYLTHPAPQRFHTAGLKSQKAGALTLGEPIVDLFRGDFAVFEEFPTSSARRGVDVLRHDIRDTAYQGRSAGPACRPVHGGNVRHPLPEPSIRSCRDIRTPCHLEGAPAKFRCRAVRRNWSAAQQRHAASIGNHDAS